MTGINLKRQFYEISPDGTRPEALENVIRDISAASRLGIPFTVQTVTSREFRHGGNVNKAKVESYMVTFGEAADLGEI